MPMSRSAAAKHQSASYANVGWNVSFWTYSIGRFSGEISSPQGRSVGFPNSSWFHQFPKRPMPCATRSPGRDAVGELGDVCARALGDDHADDHPEPDPAPHAEPALPDGERPPPLVRELVPARDHVVQARPHDAGRDAPDGAAEDEVPVAAPPRPADARDDDRCGDRDEERQPVEMDRERPELDRARVGRRDGSEYRRRHGPRHSADKSLSPYGESD